MADPWALFIDGDDYTDHTSADTISVVSRAHAQTGVLTAVVRDEDADLPIALDQEVQLVALRNQGGDTTLAASAAIGATNLKVTSVAGLSIGEELVVGDHPTAELRTISSVGTAGAGGTGVGISVALAIAHGSGEQVYDAERLFAGTIRRRTGSQDGSARLHHIQARDYTDLLAQDVIDVAFRSTDESDKERVEWLISTWGAKGVTAGAEVIETLAQMPLGEDGSSEQDLSGKTVEGALRQIEAITGARHYVDFHKRLHYFLAESNAAPFALSDAPNGTTSWPYHRFSMPEDSVSKVNAVYVFGAELDTGQIRGWRPDPPPAAADRRAAVIRDTGITSQDQLDAVGDAYLAVNGEVRREGSLRTYRSGFLAGQTVQVTNAAWALSAEDFVITEVVLAIEAGVPVWTLSIGDEPLSLTSQVGAAQRASVAAIAAASVADSAVRSVADLSAAGANLVRNSSFENADLTHWTVGSGWTFGYDPVGPEEAFAGSKVARAVAAGGAGTGLLETELIRVERDDDYWLSWWSFVRSLTAGAVVVEMKEYDSSSGLLGTTELFRGLGSEADWTRRSIHMGPNDSFGRTEWGVATAFVQMVVWMDGATGTWDVDGFQVERGRLLTAYAPTPQELLDESVGTTQISDDAITTPKIATNAIVAGKVAAGEITTVHFAADAIIANVANVGGTVLINSDGIFLEDYLGKLALTTAGFVGPWSESIYWGVINGGFSLGSLVAGLTATTEVGGADTPDEYDASLSADIPYWVVRTRTGSCTYAVDDDGGDWWFQVLGNFTATVAPEVQIYQDVPVAGGQPFSAQIRYKYASLAANVTLSIVTYELAADKSTIVGFTTKASVTVSGSDSNRTLQFTQAELNPATRYVRVLVRFFGTTIGCMAGSANFDVSSVQVTQRNPVFLDRDGDSWIHYGLSQFEDLYVGVGANEYPGGQSAALGSGRLELRRSAGTPYIDFANDSVDDFDARLILMSADVMELQGASLDLPLGITEYEGWTSYTPTVSNGGAATYSTRTGHYVKIGKIVLIRIYIVVGVAGSGAGLISITTPSTPDRASSTRQAIAGNHESGGAAAGTVSLVTLAGDAGTTWSRLRSDDGVNIAGSDLQAGSITTLQGWYMEA